MTGSRPRNATEDLHPDKAEEQTGLLKADERVAGAIDLGCGAGELLEFLVKRMRVVRAVDFSETILAVARKRLEGSGLELVHGDVFSLLPNASEPVWMTSGALNQFLSEIELDRLVGVFAGNAAARTFALYDCVDPLRLRLVRFGSSFLPLASVKPTSRERASYLYHRARFALGLGTGRLNRDVQYLGSTAMGYGVLPRFWHKLAEPHGLEVRIVGSRIFEYRYHVLLRKVVGKHDQS